MLKTERLLIDAVVQKDSFHTTTEDMAQQGATGAAYERTVYITADLFTE